ncbi:MAG: response regulator transcription factor [Actinomycetaceae bacterium]|nr:response regulator transcription factor [Actinomycetaceae bacterium]
MNNKIRILIADDDPIIREGLAELLSLQAGIEVVATAANGSEALNIINSTPIDLALLDVDMPVIDGIETARRIGRGYPHTTIVMLTAFEHEESLGQSIATGVKGFLTKDIPVPQLAELLKRAHAGETVMSPKPLSVLTSSYRQTHLDQEKYRDFIDVINALPERKREVFDLLIQAKTNRTIAKEVYLSEGTVRVYVSDILEQTGCASRAELVAKAFKSGIG